MRGATDATVRASPFGFALTAIAAPVADFADFAEPRRR